MGRALGVLLAVLLVLGGAGVAAAYLFDSQIRAAAADQVATQLQGSVPFAGRPTVTIEGHPFVWRLLTRDIPSVRIQGEEMPVQADATTTVPLYDVDVTLTRVVPDWDAVRAGSLAGTGRLSYDDLSRLADARVTQADDARLAFEKDLEFSGLRFTGRLTGRPALNPADQTLTLEDTELDVAGVRIPAQATQSLVDTMLKPFRVTLPYDLRLASVSPDAGGLRVGVEATDPVFPLR